MLRAGRAAIFRRYPFTIILKDRVVENSAVHLHRVKIDPGSGVTGLAVVREDPPRVVWAAEVEHRGEQVRARMLERAALRRARRSRKTRYREPRFKNRRRREGWLPPSLESRVANVLTWVRRLMGLCRVSAVSVELAKFDTQLLQDPEIRGVGYQRGTLFGCEVKEYLLEKWGRRCAYCGRENLPLEVEHVVPKSRGGTDRVSNLVMSCRQCNDEKGGLLPDEWLQRLLESRRPRDQLRAARLPAVLAQLKEPLRAVAAVNATRWELYRRLCALGLPVEAGTGGRTRHNRLRLGLPKAHWADAACAGESTPGSLPVERGPVLRIRACGHGRRRRANVDRYGFPVSHAPRRKVFLGFRTGDLVRARVPRGEHTGVHVGRVAIRFRPWFRLGGFDVHPRHLVLLQRADGYEYGFVSPGASSPGLKAGAPGAA